MQAQGAIQPERVSLKQCNKCKRWLPLGEFYKDKSRKDGLSNQCKECKRIWGKTYRQMHREEIIERKKEYYQEHREQLKEKFKRYYQEHREQAKQYNQTHKEQINLWRRLKYRNDLKFNLNMRMSSMLYRLLHQNKENRAWEKLLGYTCEDLEKRLLETMPAGYTWQDYLDGTLHIDHILPVSKFNFDKPEHPDFKRAWDLKNLQLLPAEENRRKSNKCGPFQPMLKLATTI